MSLELMMAKIYIDDKPYEVDGSKNLLETALSIGLNLPYFCWHPAMHSVGACRQCAIIKYKDADDKKGKLVMACMEPVADNLHVSIEAPEAHAFRAGNVEALMTNHPHDCPVCDEGGECHLQDMTVMTGHNQRRYCYSKRTHNNQYLGPFVNHEMNRCIQCYRCVRFYKDYAGGKDLDVFAAHNDVYFGRQEEGVLESEFSGNLVEVCPTGVFTDKTLKKHYTRKWDLTNAPSVCHQCSLGCNIIASERYGTIRRVLSRYNGDVNGYFLCDRGRFGYEYVNSKNRIIRPAKLVNGTFAAITAGDAVQEIKAIINTENNIIGIGSPKASMESNFLLRELVGPANFYAGVPTHEGKLIRQVIEILDNGKVKTPSLSEAKTYDAVFILGEDLTNTAPMLALSLRQAAKNEPNEIARALKIPDWNDAATREAVQEATGPFFIAAAHDTKLDDIATGIYHASPDQIADLANAVAGNINKQLNFVTADPEIKKLAGTISTALLTAKKPLIVAGTSLYSEAIIQAAANIAYALKDQDKDAGIIYVLPEANSAGSLMLADQYLEDAFAQASPKEAKSIIILENDLYQRMDKTATDNFLQPFKNIISLDYLENSNTRKSTLLLPAGTFAEADGTIISNEGRVQRFYQVHVPENDVRSSWKWLAELTAVYDSSPVHLDEVIDQLITAFPVLQAIQSAAPPAGFREDTQKIPRSPQRYSGRTAINADLHVSEPKPPADPDSALSYTMEGYVGIPPPALTPFYWSPGWNSAQAINKYQIEVGGELHGGNPGKRLFEPDLNSKAEYFNSTPSAYSLKEGEGQYMVLPLYHIFGSDELSALSPAVAERVPQPYIALNDSDAAKAGIEEGAIVEVLLSGNKKWLPVKLKMGLPQGTAGLPKGLRETAGIAYPFFTTLKIAGND
jgi:NADH-quinone oxidoreductase subunit G